MLHLVANGRATGTVPAPTQVALWGIEAELADYIEGRLRACWPALQVRRETAYAPVPDSVNEVWICGHEPPPMIGVPTLWLGALDRSESPVRLRAGLWTCSMPISGRKLQRVVRQMLATPIA